jgi:tetratricopeptide (TPR) repeat protein
MRKQDFLIELIQSLDPNERRYFKLLSNVLSGEKKYVQLFDLLETRKDYDAATIAAELGISSAQLAVTKHYLGRALLKSIRIYKEDSSDEWQLMAAMQEAEELIGRNLRDSALQTLEKAITFAEKIESLHLLPGLLALKQDCLYQLDRYDEAVAIKEKSDKALSACAEYAEVKRLNAIVVKFEQSRLSPEKFKADNRRLLQKKVPKMLTAKAQILWFNTLSYYYLGGNCNYTQLLNIALQAIRYFEAGPKIVERNYIHYLGMYNKLAGAYYMTGDYKNAWLANQKCIQLVHTAPKNASKVGLDRYVFHTGIKKVEILSATFKYEDALVAIQQLYKQRERFMPYEQFSVAFMHAMLLLHLERSAEAGKVLDELLEAHGELLSDLQSLVRVIQVLVQFDLGNYTLIPYLIRSSRAWLKRKKISLPEIDIFFSHAYSIANAAQLQRKSLWAKLRSALQAGKMKELNKNLNLEGWLERKLETGADRAK